MDLDGPRSFTVIMRGQTFSITEPQIRFAPGNFFEKALLGDFSESKSGVLHLDRSPHTFSIILDYLSGYNPLPLAEGEWLSSGLDESKFLRYLQSDAQYYGLDELEKLVSAEIKRLQAIRSSAQRNEPYKGMPPFDDFMRYKTFEMLRPHLRTICMARSTPGMPVSLPKHYVLCTDIGEDLAI